MTSKLFEETTAPYMYTGQDYLEPKTTATEPIPVKDFPISLVFNGEPLYTKSRVEQLLKSLSGEVEELKVQLEYEKTKNDAYRKLESAYWYLLGKYPTEDYEAREILCKAQRLFLGQTSPYRGY